jgi:hypothetical protein
MPVVIMMMMRNIHIKRKKKEQRRTHTIIINISFASQNYEQIIKKLSHSSITHYILAVTTTARMRTENNSS